MVSKQIVSNENGETRFIGRDNHIEDINSNRQNIVVCLFKVFFKILESENPDVIPAKKILQRILKRDFYQSVVEINVKKHSRLNELNENQVRDEILAFVGKSPIKFSENHLVQFQEPVRNDEIVVIRRIVDMGMGNSNPVQKVSI